MTSKMIGTRVLRVEDPALLKGRSTFVANLDLPGALVAHYVTSIEAHALITGIDTDEARTMPGVVDVVTAADLDFGPIPGTPPDFPDGVARGTLATDRVRFVGEPIVAIVAETIEQAADAAETVVIDYESLPVVVDLATAADNETLLFPSA
ncbi:MAG: xanthine dehydrogenase family protein molybdopterin-binding subunit, partial [Acidimicrobiales bacterium]